MKQIIIIVISFICIILLDIYQVNFLENTSRYILSDIQDIKNAISRNDLVDASNGVSELEDTWKNLKAGWDIFGEHDEIKEINEHIVKIKVYVEYNEVADAFVEIASLENLILHIVDTESLKISNVL